MTTQQPEWVEICKYLDNDFNIDTLRGMVALIDPRIDLRPLSKAALCKILADDYEDNKSKFGTRSCHNEAGIIETEGYDNISDSEIVFFADDGHQYCLTLEEFGNILGDEAGKNPFTRNPLSQKAIDQYGRKLRRKRAAEAAASAIVAAQSNRYPYPEIGRAHV